MIGFFTFTITLLVLTIILFFIFHWFISILTLTRYFIKIIKLLINDKHDYFFRMVKELIFDRDNSIGMVGSLGEYIVFITDSHGGSYIIDINLPNKKFNMRMVTFGVKSFIFGEELNDNDINKFNGLIERLAIKEKQREFLNDFEIETYYNK